MSASLADILTTQKNGVVAVNGIAQATARSLGTQTSVTVTTATVIYVGKGYLVNFSVVVAGSAVGTISNAGDLTTVAANISFIICVYLSSCFYYSEVYQTDKGLC